MQRPDPRLARAHARDAAMQRMRRLTFAAVAGATALAALFSGLVAKAVPGRKTAATPTARTARKATAATKTTTRTTKIAPAPAPIVPVGGGGDGSQSQSQSQPQQTPAAPAQAPVQSYAPPVASSGGS